MLLAYHREQGAVVADDVVVPLHYGDPAAEYRAAHEAAVLIDRSHEGRLMLAGADRLKIVHRISTNAVEALGPGEGRATVFTTPIGRIIDRAVLHNLDEHSTLVRTGEGRGARMAEYLRRNVFFRDRMTVQNQTDTLAQFVVYGPRAGELVATFAPGAAGLLQYHNLTVDADGVPLILFNADWPEMPGIGIIGPVEQATSLWTMLLDRGTAYGLRPSGQYVYDLLRIEAGIPGPAGELTEEYLPLEAGLWADVSFTKGCYTGQEIIARMESRGQLAKTLVRVTLSGAGVPGAAWTVEGRAQGMLTSAARLPDDRWIGLGFVKTSVAAAGQVLDLPDGITAVIEGVPRRAAHS